VDCKKPLSKQFDRPTSRSASVVTLFDTLTETIRVPHPTLDPICLILTKENAAVAMLQSWIDDEDEEEQQETGQYLINALDEDRLSDRKLFLPELKARLLYR
jgi:hypothetical protein